MFLPRTSCIICGEHIAKIQYNLKTTYSEASKILLIKLVENCYENIVLLHCNICSNCYSLLNELDAVKQKEKELYGQLKSNIFKLKNSKPSIDEEEDVPGNGLSSELPVVTLPKNNIQKNKKPKRAEGKPNLSFIDIDLTKLPVKVKRIPTKNDHHKVKAASPSKPVAQKAPCIEDNEKVFEQIQSSIQMDLSKHVEEHMNKCKPVKNILCEICEQNFKTKAGYISHMKKHKYLDVEMKLLTLNKVCKNWFCHVCEKNFHHKGDLARHLRIHTGETRYQCKECGKKFLHHSSFDMHRKIHAGERNFKCATCNHGFLTNFHLKRHIRSTHDKEKTHVCGICNKRFFENYRFISHMKTVHKERDNDVQHQEDDKTILYYQMAEETLAKGESLIHIEEGPTIQSLMQMEHVEEHMIKCKFAENILCEVCGQNFKTKAGYVSHMKTHEYLDDEMKLLTLNKVYKNWFCHVCGENFNQKGDLARHLIIHTGETRCQCKECGKKFLHHSSFNVHRKIHAGQRYFKCATCNHGFHTNFHLKRHIRSTHDKETTHVCGICNKIFFENDKLIAHMKTVHKGETLIHIEEIKYCSIYE